MGDRITFMRIIRLLGIAAKLDLAWLVRDTKYAVAIISADIISNLSALSGVFLIAVRFGGIGGMSSDEVLLMMAFSTMTTGLFMLFGTQNNIHISRIIGRGQLEHLFMQPLSLKVQLLTCGFSPFTGSQNFIVGVIIMVIAVKRLRIEVTAMWVLLLAAYLFISLAIIVARAYLVSSMAFYAPVAAEEISTTAIEGTWFLSTFPLSGMPKFMQVSLVTILPEGLLAWFPALCMLGKPPLGLTAYYPAIFALLLSLAAGYIFKKGLKYYVKTGANRYLPYGFRR